MRGARAWARVARYLGKYLSKGFGTVPGNRRAHASGGDYAPRAEERFVIGAALGGAAASARSLAASMFDTRTVIRHWSFGGLSGFTIDTC